MENETTLDSATLEEGVDSTGSEGDQPSGQEGRKLDPVEMQKTLSKQFTEIDKLKKELAKSSGTGSSAGIEDKISKLEQRIVEKEFYADNPDYKPFQTLISKLGSNPLEVVQTNEFKQLAEKAIAFDKLENAKSVLKSNPRLSKATDNLSEAKSKIAEANKLTMQGDHYNAMLAVEESKTKAVNAVLDAFERK
ncbi:hypothetical protein M0R04_12760 [Candidatus Dojkabacteria bacterium]|jgi:hypothetical protein|nr:hypothetical protein [Candidatus Dojkabacteria bacterium]